MSLQCHECLNPIDNNIMKLTFTWNLIENYKQVYYCSDKCEHEDTGLDLVISLLLNMNTRKLELLFQRLLNNDTDITDGVDWNSFMLEK